MNKENFLFGFIGLIAGLVIGFMFANSVNRGTATVQSPASTMPGATMPQNAELPPGHPQVTGNNPTAAQMENLPEIRQAMEKAGSEPNNFDAQVKAGELYYQIGSYEKAADFYLKANKIKPDDYDTLVKLGNSYFDGRKYEEAEKWYAKALAKKPEDLNVRTDLGLTFVLRSSPNYDKAIEEFNRSLSSNPNHVPTLQNMTVAYTKKGDAEKAKATLAKVEGLEPGNEAIPRLKEEIAKINK